MFTCTLTQYVAYKTNVAQQFTPQKHYRLPHPGQGILGPAPAIYASQPTPLPSAFSTMPLQDPTWHMDTGASSHLNFNASNLSTIFDKLLFPSVHVGDGKSIPVTNIGHSIIPSHHRPLHLHNVLVTPNIIKNLIFVRQFTRNNNYTIEFDAFGFSVKDYLTCHILLRCDSSSDLYRVTKPSTSPIAFLSTSASTWHQHLRHPGDQVLRSLVSSRFISGNRQVKYNKIDLLVQQYEQFVISEDESIDNAFTRFNTIITSLKALDEGYSSKNYVRKFLRALHPKWRSKVTAIEESKDLTSLSLDELIGNLKVHEMIIKKDSKIVKAKIKRKSIALKDKKESSYEECSTCGSEDEESRDDKNGKGDRKLFRCGDPNHLIGECPNPPKDKNQRAFVRGSWSVAVMKMMKGPDEKCLVAHASSEVLSVNLLTLVMKSSIDDIALDKQTMIIFAK
ncbi:hypothetical protein Tco_0243463 [Tanacetum coccineum]